MGTPDDRRNAEAVGHRRSPHDVPVADRQARLNRVAQRQWGVLTVAHLTQAGLSEPAVRRWTAAGRLHRLHRGVYALAPPDTLTPQARDLAAVWACGDRGALCALSAALRWGLLRHGPPQPQVLVRATGRRRIDGIDLRVTVDLPPSDVTTREGIPITTVERTVLDLAASALSNRAVESAAAQAERDGWFRRPAQLRVAARARHRKGAARLRTILHVGPRLWRSEEEAAAAVALVSAGLPEPVIAHVVPTDIGGLEVDLSFPDHRLILEVDGRQHELPLQGWRDVDRDAALARAGWATVRVAAAQVREQPDAVVRTVAAALRRAGWQGSPSRTAG
ncbi:MAG: hypothetical protein JWN65_1651 [Solirubrobacterales bacterium]|nr:hypothetical protein [Solirubrobacterales bacterium]